MTCPAYEIKIKMSYFYVYFYNILITVVHLESYRYTTEGLSSCSPLFISMNYKSNQIRQNAYSMNCLLRKLSYFASLFVQCIRLSMFDHDALSTTCTRHRNQCTAI